MSVTAQIIVDPEDLPVLNRYHWTVDTEGYAAANIDGRKVRLHRFLMGEPPGMLVDHRNRNRLDCRRLNLRITDRNGNARNSKFRSHNTSGFRGVYFCRQTGRWRAEIRVDSRGIKLGRFESKEDAARAYDEAARRYHGEFAVLNFSGPADRGCAP